MDKETLELLVEALAASPDNQLLRKQVARAYFKLGEYENAKQQFSKLVQYKASTENKLELAHCYAKLKSYGPAIIICEEILDKQLDTTVISLYIQLLIDNQQEAEAIDKYQAFQQQLPNWKDIALESQLKIGMQYSKDEGTEEADDPFLENPKLNFAKVGGMEHHFQPVARNTKAVSGDAFLAADNALWRA